MDAVRLREHLTIIGHVRHPVRKRLVVRRLMAIAIYAWATKQPLPLPFIVDYSTANLPHVHCGRQRMPVSETLGAPEIGRSKRPSAVRDCQTSLVFSSSRKQKAASSSP